MAAPSLARFFAGPLFPQLPFPMGSAFCALHDSLADCARRNILPREDPLFECDRLCGTTPCLFTALWLQQSQSILMQEIDLGKAIDLTCYQTLPTRPSHSYTSFESPVALPAESDPIQPFTFP